MTDWDSIRSDFPALRRYRYFYSASGGPLPRPVFERSVAYLKETLEHGDRHWERNLEQREAVRRQVAQLINAAPVEVEFMTSTAQGMNLLAQMLSGRGDTLATTLEFPDTTLPWLNQRRDSVRWVLPDQSGAVPVERFRAAMSPGSASIATSHVQFSNGFRQDLERLGRFKGRHRLIVNATQSLGAFEIDVKRMKIDALCCNSYKWMLAGYGCGILYLDRSLLSQLPTPVVGWFGVKDRNAFKNDRFEPLDSMERFNVGSPAFAAIFSLGAAIEYLQQIGIPVIQKRVLKLNGYLTDQLKSIGYQVLSPIDPPEYRSAQTLVRLGHPQRTVDRLKHSGIICTPKPLGMRVATHFFNNAEDIDVLVAELSRINDRGS